MTGMPGSQGNGSSTVAAVDLGSNSFHLLIARVLGDQVAVLDRLREPVRLAADLDSAGVLGERALERMLEGLGRFRERLVDLPSKRVRAVGTDTFRRVKQPKDILARASAALGFPIEVLPGGEEARLIYLGVAHEEPAIDGRRLVLDIGGGSTECILGKRFAPLLKDSLAMGCVNFSRRFFDEGRFTRKAFRKAEVAAALEFEPLQRRYQEAGWEDCVGSSGTINAVSDVVRESGWSEGALTLSDVKRLRRALIAAEEAEKLDLPGLTEERAQVLAGGLAILKAAFETLGIESLRVSKAALREGVLYDLLGRIRHEDVRDRTIRALSERYHVDSDQAERVERTARRCLDQVAEAWKLEPEGSAQLLTWAARMHEVGLALSHSGHQKHGGYILENSDMPGFSRQDQLRLAALVKTHRRKLARNAFAEFPEAAAETLLKLSVLLRIAVRLHRTRSPKPLPSLHLRTVAGGLELGFPRAWLEKHPLTSADLEEEDRLLDECGLRLRVVSE
jgi:exopolyphosphatase/guanosine-5'-triphosphate,3'-diphosphate pyrophosphatase